MGFPEVCIQTSIDSRSLVSDNGLTKKSLTPAFNAASRVPLEATAVTAMMQDGLSALLFSYSRIFLVATSPSITGIDISATVVSKDLVLKGDPFGLTHQHEGISLIGIAILLESYESIGSRGVVEAKFAYEFRHDLRAQRSAWKILIATRGRS